ncbi:MAG: YncE family protein [Gemmatimonadota bacterium]
MIVHLALLAALQQGTAATPPDRSYLLFVASAGTDEVALVRFGRKGMLVEHHTPLRLIPGEPASPAEVYSVPRFLFDTMPVVFDSNLQLSSAHGFANGALTSGPRHLTSGTDGRTYFVTTDRGLPAGELLKLRIARDSATAFQPTDTIVGREPLGTGLGAAQITPDGAFAWTTVAAGIGDPRGGVAVVHLGSMTEVAMIATCAGAAGGQLTADAVHHYSLCPADDALVEIDVAGMAVSRRLPLSGSGERRCGPGGMVATPDGARIYVACSAANVVVEIDGRSWAVTRRLPVGSGPRELALTADGRMLVVVNATGRSISLLEVLPGPATTRGSTPVVVGAGGRFAYVRPAAAPGEMSRTDVYEVGPMLVAATVMASPLNAAAGAAQFAAMASAPTAVAVSPDGKYAFVSSNRVDGGAGTIEVIDLATRTVVALHQFGRGLAGVGFWKTSPEP